MRTVLALAMIGLMVCFAVGCQSGRVSTEQALAPAVKALGSGDQAERDAAATKIVKYKADAIPSLEVAAQSKDRALRTEAILALGRLGAEHADAARPAALALVKILAQCPPESRFATAFALKTIGNYAFAPLMDLAIANADEPGDEAMAILLNIDEKATIDELIGRLRKARSAQAQARIDHLLRIVTKLDFAFVTADPKNKRSAAISRWGAWWNQNRETYRVE